ncbi:MAG TPA: hypothetical protein VGY56_10520 [Verrucomicrobiae bacterium]|nr:hypothetical protein [Verrucomicrobiae bacterium]
MKPSHAIKLCALLVAGSFFNFIGLRALELRCARLVIKLRK